MVHPVILLHADAPPKPAAGLPCNGCGVCCAWQPCPLGVLASGRRQGTCQALRWHGEARQYRCGLLQAPHSVWPAMPAWLVPSMQALARRWIAAGAGCDCSAEVEPAAGPD